ncbi:ABC transporter permease [Flaviflexus massiliensis]|uniref:ABC transporter permease n=1 Tax=Flaviflexus massiliensis TaxID=1522309 RepID=UPI000AF7B74F|nr:ABC transporter permease [Flaviflexus massiliensis]
MTRLKEWLAQGVPLERSVMFVAWRELRFARGRFLLIGTVVALMTLLVGFLTGLTGGLASQNISAVLQLPGDRLVLSNAGDDQPMFSTSSINEETVSAWSNAAGVDSVSPVGITQARGSRAGSEDQVGITLFGLEAGDAEANELFGLVPATDQQVGLSESAADELGVAIGDSITVSGTTYGVAAVSGDLWYSHTPVVVMTENAWSEVSGRMGGTGDPTALIVNGSPDWDAIGTATATEAMTTVSSLMALDSFSSEIGSLALMIGMLFGISALVVGAFFTVWTMQRKGDVAVLKALGASTGSLVTDALGQALTVLVAGVGIGLLGVVAFGTLAGQALPFMLNPLTTLVPALILMVLGLAGAAFALRTITKADPLTALGSNR